MGLKTAFKKFFELDDELYEEEQLGGHQDGVQQVQPDVDIAISKRNKKQNVVSLQSLQQATKVVLVELRGFDDVQDVADQLKKKRSVVINLQRLSHDAAKRVVDFLSGTVYAIDGEMQKLGQETFLCVPENVDVSGVISEMMDKEEVQ